MYMYMNVQVQYMYLYWWHNNNVLDLEPYFPCVQCSYGYKPKLLSTQSYYYEYGHWVFVAERCGLFSVINPW